MPSGKFTVLAVSQNPLPDGRIPFSFDVTLTGDDFGEREGRRNDVYENWVNPNVTGNRGTVIADSHPLHGFEFSASLVLPANSVMVFART